MRAVVEVNSKSTAMIRLQIWFENVHQKYKMADQAARRRQRILANAEARLQKLRGIQKDEKDESTCPEQAAVADLGRETATVLSSVETGDTEAELVVGHLPARAVPPQPQPLKMRDTLDDSVSASPSEDAPISSSARADIEQVNREAAVSSPPPTIEASSSNEHSTVAEQHAEKLEQMHQKKKQLPQKRTRVSRLWLLLAVVLAAILVFLHVNSVVTASSACSSLVVMATTQTLLQRPKSALQFVVSLLSQILTSVSLFMFTLVVYHMVQTTVAH